MSCICVCLSASHLNSFSLALAPALQNLSSTLSNLSWRTAAHILVSFKRFILLFSLLVSPAPALWLLPLSLSAALVLIGSQQKLLQGSSRSRAASLKWFGCFECSKMPKQQQERQKKENREGNRSRSVGNGKCYPISKSK